MILMSNHAVANPMTDNNGAGVARTFALDLSALGSFNTATLITLDSATPASGPIAQSLTPSAQMQVTLPGYGAALLRLANSGPSLASIGVVNAASYVSGPVAPGEILSLFGSNIGPSEGTPGVFTNPRLVANSLAGIQVFFDGVPAPVLYGSSKQVNTVVPFTVAGHATTQLQLEYLGVFTTPLALPVALTAPAVFSLDATGKGGAAVLNQNGTINSSANPAHPGDTIAIFATGTGSTTPASYDGLLNAVPLPTPNAGVLVTIGGASAHVTFAGAAPGLIAGALQINAQIPSGTSTGSNVPLQVTMGTAASQTGITVAIQ